ncbi:tRNA pseudouridine synthase Pus10 isoform X4 [Austrofundulus limnaeus]|uniref:tRNA pseudouridine synthase Pus10 n=1 Tax=Austrofundulus limnaeus TaxID=52670 RepID=A0A2I4CW60_AUSLI|nr:PREDICTED: putative tRNA pseudouridine synthase Pus10 isoform X4 [Austrofundulus limnaeus]
MLCVHGRSYGVHPARLRTMPQMSSPGSLRTFQRKMRKMMQSVLLRLSFSHLTDPNVAGSLSPSWNVNSTTSTGLQTAVMLPLKEKDKPIIQKLLSAGCCARCVLRFCCLSNQAAYRQPSQEILKELQDFITEKKSSKVPNSSTAENNKSHDLTVSETLGDPPSKKSKLEPIETVAESEKNTAAVVRRRTEELHVCVVCLGILQGLCEAEQAVKLYVREHSCWLHVKEEVSEKSLVITRDDVIQVKEAFKWTLQGLVAKEIGGIAVVNKSSFEVGVEFTHPETDSDCHFLAKSCPDCFKPTKNKQSVFTRMAVVKALEKISDAKFLEYYPCPPTPPSSNCILQDVQCLHVSVFIAGRYNKFSRSLPQTPWLIDGERRMESSVEELIATPILSTFRADGFNFSSSGREDVDVRTLGNGRPFAMELLNPHRSRFSEVEMKQLQETINKSSDKIRVHDLQIVSREAMSHMKDGEEVKTKSYTALIWTQKPIQREDITFIDEIKDLTLDQKTPLRVLHRRALAIRQRVIHSMNTRYVDCHHFYLGLKTQAGTYIKEFVHGDFGRTQPNLCQLLKTDTNILELDVESVDVDWPPAIPE